MKDKKKQKGVVKEFKEFITRGIVVDMAVGVIIGSAFTSIVTSLTNSILLPLIGIILGGQADFKALRIKAGEPVYEADGITIAKDEFGQDLYSSSIYYGKFLQAVIDFLLIAVILFILVKIINSVRKKAEERRKKQEEPVEEPAAPAAPVVTELDLLTEIRDLLKNEKDSSQ